MEQASREARPQNGLKIEEINFGEPQAENRFTMQQFDNFMQKGEPALEVEQKDVLEQVSLVKTLRERIKSIIKTGNKSSGNSDKSMDEGIEEKE